MLTLDPVQLTPSISARREPFHLHAPIPWQRSGPTTPAVVDDCRLADGL